MQVVSYHSQHPRRETKQEETVISAFQVGPVAGHSSNTWNQPLVIPPLPPSNLTNCSLIDLDYELQVCTIFISCIDNKCDFACVGYSRSVRFTHESRVENTDNYRNYTPLSADLRKFNGVIRWH